MDCLLPGESLKVGQKIISPDGLTTLALQSNGDLVLHNRTKPVFASNTSRRA